MYHLCFHLLDEIPERNNLKEETFILAHGFGSFCSYWVGLPPVFVSCDEAETSWQKPRQGRAAHCGSLNGKSPLLTRLMNILFSVGGSVWGVQVGNHAGRSMLLRTDSESSAASGHFQFTLCFTPVFEVLSSYLPAFMVPAASCSASPTR